MRKFLNSLSRDERGIAALEYAILAAVVVVAVVTGMTLWGAEITELFTNATLGLTKANDL